MAHWQTIAFFNLFLFGPSLYLVSILLRSRPTWSLPPGPPGWPFIGNFFQIPSEKSWVHFVALGRKYGDVSTITMLGTRYVILNSYKAVSEILEKQSAKSSDRPYSTMAHELVGWGKGMLFRNYDDTFKRSRKLFSHIFGTRSSASAFHEIVEERTRQFLLRVAEQPDGLSAHVRGTTSAVILEVVYGYTVQQSEDQLVELAERAVANIAFLSTHGPFLVDLVPALRYLPGWLPGTGFLEDAKRYRAFMMEIIERPHQYVTEHMMAGTAISSFSSKLLGEGVSPEEEEIIMWTASNAYLGGSETISNTIYAFFLAMVIYPDVQKKAQAELDAVIGTDRLPSLEDRDSLPYINAICSEVLRWYPVAPLAMPHVSSEDIYVSGYLIPKGSHIIGNSWGILHDETTYPDPHVFRPERFLGENTQPDPQRVCFGYGRRICPGLHLAEASLFVTIAMSLAVLDVSRAVVNGVDVIPELDVSPGAIPHLLPFEYHVAARSPRAKALLV